MPRFFAVLFIFTLFACASTPRNEDAVFYEILYKVPWENRDIDMIQFDSSRMVVPLKDGSPYRLTYRYRGSNDTLRVALEALGTYNVVSFMDTVAVMRIAFITRDSFELQLLNNGARELFKNIRSLRFYNSETLDRFSYYVEEDKECKLDIDSALADVAANRLVVGLYYEWPFRNEKEVAQLIEQQGMRYESLGPPPDVFPVPRNCYLETMDYYVQRRYGKDFVRNLFRRADTLMIAQSAGRIFQWFECDEEPDFHGSRHGASGISVETDLPVKQKRVEMGETFAVYDPFIDLAFYVDTVGTLSNFRTADFLPYGDWNKQFEPQLFDQAVKEIKARAPWKPGVILEHKVITDITFRVEFHPRK